MVSVNIDDKDWREFLKQSIDMNLSASKRIKDFIKKELSKNPPSKGGTNS